MSSAIGKGEVIFFVGGDQSTYVNLWTGTALQTAVNARLSQGAAVGGTSAGLNVLSEHIYSAQTMSTTSRQSSTLSAPLVYGSLKVVRVPAGGTFNAISWTAAGPPYSVSATSSGLVSTAGVLY